VTQPSTVKVESGQQHTFECQSAINSRWFVHKVDPIPPHDTELTGLSGNFLTIKKISYETVGDYYCYGFNDQTKEYFVSQGTLVMLGE